MLQGWSVAFSFHILSRHSYHNSSKKPAQGVWDPAGSIPILTTRKAHTYTVTVRIRSILVVMRKFWPPSRSIYRVPLARTETITTTPPPLSYFSSPRTAGASCCWCSVEYTKGMFIDTKKKYKDWGFGDTIYIMQFFYSPALFCRGKLYGRKLGTCCCFCW